MNEVEQAQEEFDAELNRLRASGAALLAAAKLTIAAFGNDEDETLNSDENDALRALRAAIAAEEPSTWID